MTKQALDSFFRDYVNAFNRSDAAGIAEQCAFPATITVPSGTHVFDEAAFCKNVRALCDFYRRQGVAKASKRVTSVQPLSANVASVTTEDALFDERGQMIASWQHGYLLRQDQGKIRAFAAIADGEIAAWAARGTPLGS